MQPQTPSTLPKILLALYALIWIGLAIEPKYRQDWALENLLVAVALPIFVLGFRRVRFTDGAYVCLFVFFCIHAIGAHYTYAEVPIDDWARKISGQSMNELLGWQRNHYDRVVHFAYGLLIAPVAVQLLDRRAPQEGLWRWLLPILFLASHSAVYEVVEMFAALVFGGDLGVAYLGTQGDEWDAQKDMALAISGAMIAVVWLRIWRPLPRD
jgi:putative membrane protein